MGRQAWMKPKASQLLLFFLLQPFLASSKGSWEPAAFPFSITTASRLAPVKTAASLFTACKGWLPSCCICLAALAGLGFWLKALGQEPAHQQANVRNSWFRAIFHIYASLADHLLSPLHLRKATLPPLLLPTSCSSMGEGSLSWDFFFFPPPSFQKSLIVPGIQLNKEGSTDICLWSWLLHSF